MLFFFVTPTRWSVCSWRRARSCHWMRLRSSVAAQPRC